MLYLGVDQHARQITISLHDENGDVLQGFNDWLIRMLRDYRCHKMILIQARRPQETQDGST
jgi:hypothetical protein